MTPESMKGVTQNIVSLGLDDDDIDALPSAKGVKVELLSYQGFQNKPSLSLEVESTPMMSISACQGETFGLEALRTLWT